MASCNGRCDDEVDDSAFLIFNFDLLKIKRRCGVNAI